MDENQEKSFLINWIDEINKVENWSKFEIFLRRSANIVADELVKTNAKTPGIKIDVEGIVKDLGSGKMNVHLQHFFTWNHRFIAMLAEKNQRAARGTYDFIDSEMPNANFNANQMHVIESKKQSIMTLGGTILDLGVYKGGSTRALARIFPNETIHGFDSFEGIPEDWSHVLKGAFGDVKGVLPDMPENVKLYKGWFEDTLPIWRKAEGDRPISLLRIDCDIYSSTKTIFDILGDMVQKGTWIVFDELIGYRGWEAHEYKAFKEFQARTGHKFEYVSFGLTYAMG
jgi:predicted O-methyltransferase YrrM